MTLLETCEVAALCVTTLAFIDAVKAAVRYYWTRWRNHRTVADIDQIQERIDKVCKIFQASRLTGSLFDTLSHGDPLSQKLAVLVTEYTSQTTRRILKLPSFNQVYHQHTIQELNACLDEWLASPDSHFKPRTGDTNAVA